MIGVSRPLTSCSGSGTRLTCWLSARAGGRREDRLARRGQLLQPLGQVDRVADQRVLETLRRAEQRGRGRTGGQPDTKAERRQPGRGPRVVDLRLPGVHRRRRRDRPVRVVRLRERRAEHGHHRVADELHDRALLAEDGLVHRGPVRVQLPGQLARVGVLGDRRVRPDVAHQHGHLDPLGLTDAPASPPGSSRPGRRAAAGTASRPAPRGRRWPGAAAAAGSARRGRRWTRRWPA